MALKKLSYSKYQTAIFDAIENGKGNIAVCAVAGSGKTTTIVSACRRLHENPRNVKFLAFNKLIAEELKGKLQGYADVSTLHSFGLSILRSMFSSPRERRFVRVDRLKWYNYVKDNVYKLSNSIGNDTKQEKVYGFICNVERLFDLARVSLVRHGEKKKLREMCDEHGIPTLFDEISVVDELLETAYEMPRNLTIDFTDMIVLPLSYERAIPSYKYVFIDECQDLNKAERELMTLAARGGRFIAVGDRNQAINGFCGADCQSFEKIASLPNTIELPLSVNYRCGTDILKLAQEIVPTVEAHQGAICGKVEHTKKLTSNLFKENDMVLSRTTAPLVNLCMGLIQCGKTAIVKGKDIAQDLKNLVEGFNARTVGELQDCLDNERKRTLQTIANERKCSIEDAKGSARYRNLDDRCKCIENICKYKVKSVGELKCFIDKIFSDESVKGAITLSTIHKAKGLEANRVLIILPHKLPLTWRGQADWQLKQEMNLKYVALTRAREELIFVDLSEKQLSSTVLK